MKRLFAVLTLILPLAAGANAFDTVYERCLVVNARFGYAVSEMFCSCLAAELKKAVSEKELAEYLKRDASPEDKAVDEAGAAAARACAEKVRDALTDS